MVLFQEGVIHMGQYKVNPRYRCVSTRLNEAEWEELLLLCDQSHKNTAQFLREAVSALLCERSATRETVS